MVDIPDSVLDPTATPRDPRPSPAVPSPLRAWCMWGGLGAAGIVCAASIAHAASRLGRAIGVASTRAA